MSQTELNYSVSTVNNKNGTPFILVKQSAGDINSIIDPYGLKLYRDNGNDPYVPQELIVKEHDTPTIDLELNTSSPKSCQEGKQLAIAKNITLNDQEQRNPYKRVGCTYYKTLFKKDRYGILRVEYKLWRKDEIRQDYGKEYLKAIPHYDEFTILPNNINYKSVVNNCINIYSEFAHKPKVGDWVWTERLLKQVFGEQYELGLRYMQILYLHPDRLTIILVLVSKERGTGKTTFINCLYMIFGANMVVLSNTDFSSSFNSFCTKNIIAVEETFMEKKAAVEKLKALGIPLKIELEFLAKQPYKWPQVNDHKLHKATDGNPNRWGILHLDDNVSEWVIDPNDTLAIYRGDNWLGKDKLPDMLRMDTDSSKGFIGFRIARTFVPEEINKK